MKIFNTLRIALFLLTVATNDAAVYATAYDEAQKAYNQGNLKQSILLLEEAVQTDPKNVNAYYSLGICYGQLREYGKAEQILKEMLKRFPNNTQSSNAYYSLGACYEGAGNYAQASYFFHQTIKLFPKSEGANLARKALEEISTASTSAASVSNTQIRNLFDKAKTLCDQGQFEEAIPMFTKIVEINPNDSNSYFSLGLCYGHIGRYEQAKHIFSDIIGRFPHSEAANAASKSLQEMNSLLTELEYADKTNETQHKNFVVPCRIQNSTYMVDVNINGHNLSMAVDTGSGRIIIPLAYISQIGWQKPTGQNYECDPIAGTHYWLVKANIQLGELLRENIPVYIFDTDSWPGVPILGNIFFTGFDRTFNSGSSTLQLTSPMKQSSDAYSSSSGNEAVIPFQADIDRAPIIDININGHQVKATFDTGGHDSLWLTNEQAHALNINSGDSSIVHTGSTSVSCATTTVDNVQLGQVNLHKVRAKTYFQTKAPWGTDRVVFGTAILNEQGYDFSIDDHAKLIKIKKK